MNGQNPRTYSKFQDNPKPSSTLLCLHAKVLSFVNGHASKISNTFGKVSFIFQPSLPYPVLPGLQAP